MNTKKINLPLNITESQAELVGIMFGDGNITIRRFTYLINITCNSKKDLEYSKYITKIFIKEFDIIPKVYTYPNKSAMILYIHSKVLVAYFNNTLKITSGPKRLGYIPDYILSDKTFLIAFIRGLFDTDGCVTFQNDKKYRYVLLKICTIHELFAHHEYHWF